LKHRRRTQIGILILRVGERLEITFFNDGALTISGLITNR
jgi:hypothetical protein